MGRRFSLATPLFRREWLGGYDAFRDLHFPQVGSAAGPEALVMVALNGPKIWVSTAFGSLTAYSGRSIRERLIPFVTLLLVKYKNVLDPIETLTFAAAHTSRIALATGVLNLPWYNPVLLARRLTTLDILSAGRLRVGFGIGWSPDEYEAAGAVWHERGKPPTS